MIALTPHICAHWSSVIVTEHKRFTSGEVVVLRRSFISSIAIAMISLNLETSNDPPGLKEYHTAFCPKDGTGAGSVDGSTGDTVVSIDIIVKVRK